jgi:hypothetical protein
MTFHWWEMIGIASAVVLAWGAVMMRIAKDHIDNRIDSKLAECVKDAIHNGVTERMDRIEMKLDRLTALHLKGEAHE